MEEIGGIWYRRPAEPVPSQQIEDQDDYWFATQESEEALLGLWRILDCTWVSHPDALAAASYKPAQLSISSQLGFEVPRTLVTNDASEAKEFLEELGGLAIIKPLRYGLVRETEEYEEVIFTNLVRLGDLESRVGSIALCPCFFQEYIPKKVEIRATVVGRDVFAAEIHSQETPGAEHDWRKVPAAEVEHARHDLPGEVADRCVRLVERLGLNFGAIDLICTPDGRYVFLEINPNGQWLWIETLTGLPITDSLISLLAGGVASPG